MFSVSCFSVFAYSPADLIHNDIFHLPHFPDDGQSSHLVFTEKEGSGNIQLYSFSSSNNIFLNFCDYYHRYLISNTSKSKINKYKLNDNFEWQFLSSTSELSPRFSPFISDFNSYGENYLLYYYTDFDFYYDNYDGSLLTSPSTLDYPVEFVNSYDDIFYEPMPEGWFDEIMNSVSSFVGGILNGLVAPLQGIANALNSMWEAIKNIPSLIIDGLKSLFIPENNLKDKTDILFDKIGYVPEDNEPETYSRTSKKTYRSTENQNSWIGQVIVMSNNMILQPTETDEYPKFEITLNGKSYSLIDWSIYAPYRAYVNAIIIGIAYFVFINKLLKRIPGVIGGFHGN